LVNENKVMRNKLQGRGPRVRAGKGGGLLGPHARSGAVQWIINDWDAYDAAWESAYAYALSDDEAAEDGCGPAGGSGQDVRGGGDAAEAASGAGGPGRDVLLPWDM